MKSQHPLPLALAFLLLSAPLAHPQAGPLRDRLQQRQQELTAEAPDPDPQGEGAKALSCAEWERRASRLQRFAAARHPSPTPDYRDLPYGPGRLETLDVYTPKPAGNAPAPIIALVHGGGWCIGDKAGAALTENKVARWVAKGFVFVSLNYPMVNEGSDALAQARHVAQAIAYVQRHAGEWGGDPRRVILMGHSAGAHLVSLVNADPRIREAHGIKPLLGAVSLDAGALDVVRQMPQAYPFLKARYRQAFGDTEAQWIAASPFHQLERGAAPWLGVCSTTRKDNPCGQARAYAQKSQGLGLQASVLPQPKSHGALNQELGLPGDYTRGVEAFMATLDPGVARLLK